MRPDFLSPRSWIIFFGAEALLAGVLWMIGLLSPILLIVLGILLLGGLWVWDNRPQWSVRIAQAGIRSLQNFSGTGAESAGQTGGDTAHFVGTVSALPVFNPSGLYVGEIKVRDDELSEHLVLKLEFLAFNGTGKIIDINRLKGHIAFRATIGGEKISEAELPSPTLIDKGKNERRAAYRETRVIVEQRVPRNVADIIAGLKGEDSATLGLENLNILAAPSDASAGAVRLPLWDGIVLRRTADSLKIGKSVMLRAGLKSSSASVSG